MRIYTDHRENLTARRGLYCIWVPAREGKATHLVARWINPQAETAGMREADDSCVKEEARQTWLGASLRAA